MRKLAPIFCLASLVALCAGERAANAGQSTNCTGNINTLSSGTTGVNISSGGVWCVTHNLTFNDNGALGTAINVAATNVTIDLNGYTLNFAGTNSSSRGIYINGSGVNVINGTIIFPTGVLIDQYSWNVTVQDVNIYSYGPIAFFRGINIVGGTPSATNIVIDRCHIQSNAAGQVGIYTTGGSVVIKHCYIQSTVNNNQDWGIDIDLNSTGPVTLESNDIIGWYFGVYHDTTVGHTIATNNRIVNTNYGFYLDHGYLLMDSNRILNSPYGIVNVEGNDLYMNTLMLKVLVPYSCNTGAICNSVGNNS